MMRAGRRLIGGGVALGLAMLASGAGAAPSAPRAAASKAAATAAEAPLFQVRADAESGKIVATLPAADAEGLSGRFIYVVQLESGSGSAQLNLDRGAASNSRLLVFRRVGKKVVAEIENARFLAPSGGPDDARAIRTSFPPSTIWAGEVIDTLKDGRFTVDLASFVLRDELSVSDTVKGVGAGSYKLDEKLSVADPAAVRAFPRNVELAARLTFNSDESSAEIDNVAPSRTFTLVQRHSFIALPEPGFVSRTDPFGYAVSLPTYDYSAPLGAPLLRNLALRFRLEKEVPGSAPSRVRKPIVFYIDPAAPEPVRSALRDGVGWWNQAFAAAGFIDAFRAEILPPGADPLDLRYNVVNWVNRATRGWSLGESVYDPRTGEILKGIVRLGSLRSRQDMLIFQALVGAGMTGRGGPEDPVNATLARLRQLGAHEVGHALGFQHNFAASSQGRASVMDYPAPRITLADGRPSLRDAYGSGIGDYDKFAVRWLYGAVTDAEAAPIVAEGRRAGIRFVSDEDGRPVGTAHPAGAIWDDGADPVSELRRVSAVRTAALARFGEDALQAGQNQADLRRSFVPIWLLDRYQVEATAKLIGGLDFGYALVGEGSVARPVGGAAQGAAIEALLQTLSPQALTVPARLLPILSGGSGIAAYDRQFAIEVIPGAGGPVFDPLKASEVKAAQTLNALLAPERLNRIEAQHSADPSVPSVGDLVDRLTTRLLEASGSAVGRRAMTGAAMALARVQRNAALSPALALQLSARLERLAERLVRLRGEQEARDWGSGLAGLLRDREALDKALADPARTPRIPPGMPIGMDD